MGFVQQFRKNMNSFRVLTGLGNGVEPLEETYASSRQKTVLLIGLGNFGMLVAKQLQELGHEVLAVDKNKDRVEEALPYVTQGLIGSSTSPAFLTSIGVNNYDVCMVMIGSDFQSSLETASLLKELGARCVIARAEREVQNKFLLRNGADEVVNPEKQMAKWAAVRYTANHVMDYIMLGERHSILEVTFPRDWVGKTIRELDIRVKYGVNILGVKENGNLNLTPSPDEPLTENMTLLVLGEMDALKKCFRI